MYKVALVRSTSYKVKNSQYNVQEIGLANELSKLGLLVDVYLISDREETYIEKCGFESRVKVYWLKGISIPGRQAYFKDLKKCLNGNKYQLIWALDDSQITTVLVSQYCKKKKIKFVLWQGMYENYPEKHKRLLQYIFDFTLLPILRRNTNYCIAKTFSAKKYLESKKFSNISVIPVGLAVDNFLKGKAIDYKKKLNIKDDYKILLYIGKVEERRKPIFCLDVYEEVKKQYNKCCLVYVGQGPLIDNTKEYVKVNGIKDVHFVDKIPQEELQSLYEDSSIFILPTKYEIFGMVLLESMYFGTPVITYKAAGPLDVIENDVDGIIIDNFNVKKWSDKIYKYLLNTNAAVVRQKCKKKIKDNYMWDKVAKDYYGVIKGIIEG